MIYLLLAPGFEETEAICPLDLMRRAGLDVKTVAVVEDRKEKTVLSRRNIRITADLHFSELSPDEQPEAVVIPGGIPGADNLNIPPVHRLLQSCYRAGGTVAAICAGPQVLGASGLLEGKKAVCYPGFEEKLTGATILRQPVVKDGRCITAVGMGASLPFGLMLVEALKDRKTAKEIEESILPSF